MACKRGCSACCRGLFDITLLDACLLRDGFDRLPDQLQKRVRDRACKQLEGIREVLWPDFTSPWLLNSYPEEEWELAMPDKDETPCSLLGEDGFCLVYDSRPMTCRLHGAPLVDTSGEVLFDEWCSLNFVSSDPLQMAELRWHFNDIFKQEQLLFREFTKRMLGKPFNELDTMIPAAVFIDFNHFDLPEPLWIQSSF
jgi:Fe-S-cluster containining protein